MIIVYSTQIPQTLDDANSTDTALYKLMVIGCLLWVVIYVRFQGLKNTFMYIRGDKDIYFQDFGLGIVKEKYRDWMVPVFECIPLIIPFILIYYKYKFVSEFVQKQYAQQQIDPNYDAQGEIKALIVSQLAREDIIIQTIPLVLFGVGIIFENKKFYHNKFLLGGVFFGTGIPMMINGLIVDDNLSKLLIMEMTQYMFITFGITMIVQSLLKYYLFTTKNKNRTVNTDELRQGLTRCNELYEID